MYRENKYFLGYILKKNKKYFCISVGINMIRGFSLAFANVLFLKVLFDNIEKQADFRHVVCIIGLYGIYQLIISFLYNWQWHYFSPIQKEKLSRDMRNDIFLRCKNISLSRLDEPKYYEEYKWCLDGVVELSNNIIQVWCDLLSNLSSLVVVCAVLIQVDYRLLIVDLVSFILLNFFNSRIGSCEAESVKELNMNKRKNDYVNRVFYLKEYAKDIRMSNVRELLLRNFHDANDKMGKTQKEYSRKISFLICVRDILMFLINYLFVILYVTYSYVKLAKITLGGITAVLNSIWTFTGDLEGICECYKRFSVFAVYIEKIRKFMEDNPVEGVLLEEGLEEMPSEIDEIEFKNVCFRYECANEDTIKNMSFKVKGNQKIAIVGKNGNGKTTMIKLLLGLYQPTSGEILINGKKIESYSRESFYNKVGCVFQNFQIYAASVIENMKMDLVEEGEQEAAQDVLKSFHLYDKINSLPNQIHSNLTREYDPNGIELSGGQSQRLAVSRMFYKDKTLIVLDEPTSALDAHAEYELNKQIMENMGQKSVWLITHRLSSVCDADAILFIQDGQIKEKGTHKELLEMGGAYAQMFQIQASKYKEQVG